MSKANEKQLKEAIKGIKILLMDSCDCEECKKDKKAYKTVLKELKRLQEENKEITFKYNTLIENKLVEQRANEIEIQSMFVLKNKIREKIEKLNENRDMISGGYAISILE